jgi:subtilase family serine protease
MFGFVRQSHPVSRRFGRLGSRWRRPLRFEELESRTLLTIYAPSQILHAYGFDKLPYDGTGQTIAIVDAYDNPNVASDLATFDQLYGLPDPVLTIAQPQGQPNADLMWGMEIDLDVQWAHAVAPGANILLVEAKAAFTGNMMAAVDYARQQPGVVAVSMSWGQPESPFQTFSDAHFTTPPGHTGGSGLPGGITFVAASGDTFLTGGNIIWPSTSTNVLSVGGTALSLDDSNNIVNEVGWYASAGGPSRYEAEADFQVPFQGYGKRTTPDISYNADVSSAYWIYDSYGFSGPLGVYGTSAGTPQWAGLIALADQALALNNIGSLDGPTQTLPALYNLANISYATYYNDIVDGSNGPYQAGPGYDLVTGLGSPVADQVVGGLANGFAPPPSGGGRAVAPSRNSITRADLTHRTVSAVPASAVLPGPLGVIAAGTLPKRGGSANQTAAFVLATMANAASEIGTPTSGVPTSPINTAPAGINANAAVAFVEPTQAPPPLARLSEISIKSGGGNGVLVDDLDDSIRLQV